MNILICFYSLMRAFLLLAGSASPSSRETDRNVTHRSSSNSSNKPVHVRSYTKKNGTVVRAYNRSHAGQTARSHQTSSAPAKTAPSDLHPMNYSGTHAYASGSRDRNGRLERSVAARGSFKRQQPCPATGKPSGPCPGYVIDHVKPLACGGADAPSNMQWQTIADGKAKDKWERNGCK
jgi:hypothetical protein